MQRRKRYSWDEILVVGGFMAVMAAVLAGGSYEAYKIVSVIPSAFAAAPDAFRSPMRYSGDDSQPNHSGRGHMTPRELSRYAAEQRGR